MIGQRRYKSTECRIREICEITQRHYEVGNQSKCYRAVWRKIIEPRYGICYRTFLNYVGAAVPKATDSATQLDLFGRP